MQRRNTALERGPTWHAQPGARATQFLHAQRTIVEANLRCKGFAIARGDKIVKGAREVLRVVHGRGVAQVVHGVGRRVVAPPVVEAAGRARRAQLAEAVLGNEVVPVLAAALPRLVAVAVDGGCGRHLHGRVEGVKAVRDGAAGHPAEGLAVVVQRPQVPLSWGGEGGTSGMERWRQCRSRGALGMRLSCERRALLSAPENHEAYSGSASRTAMA